MDRAACPLCRSAGDTPNPRLVAERVTLPIRLRRHLPRLTEVLCVLVFLTLNAIIVSSTLSDAPSDLLTNMPLTFLFVMLPRTMPTIRIKTAEVHFHCSWRSDSAAHSLQ